jgi:hypothetical protein
MRMPYSPLSQSNLAISGMASWKIGLRDYLLELNLYYHNRQSSPDTR